MNTKKLAAALRMFADAIEESDPEEPASLPVEPSPKIECYSTRTAAKALGIDPKIIERAARQGDLQGFKLGKAGTSHWRFWPEQLAKWTGRMPSKEVV